MGKTEFSSTAKDRTNSVSYVGKGIPWLEYLPEQKHRKSYKSFWHVSVSHLTRLGGGGWGGGRVVR